MSLISLKCLTLSNDVRLGIARLAGRRLGHRYAIKQAAHGVEGAQGGVLQQGEGLGHSADN